MIGFFQSFEKVKLIAVFLFFCFLIIVSYFLFFNSQTSELEVIALDDSGRALWKAQVELAFDNNIQKDTTQRNGKVVFTSLPFNKEVLVKVSGKGYLTAEIKVLLNEQKKVVELKLAQDKKEQAIEKTIVFVDPDGKKILSLLSVDFYCSSGVKLEGKQVIGGTTKLFVPNDCGSISVNVSSSNFVSKNYVDSGNGIIRLEEKEQEKGSLLVDVSNEDVSAEVFVNDSYGALVDKKLLSNGKAVFELGAGSYVVVVNSQGFSSFSRDVIIEPYKEFKLPVVLSRIQEKGAKIKVVDSENRELNAKATLYSGTSRAMTFDVSRERLFEVEIEVLVSAVGYLSKKVFLKKEDEGKEVLVRLDRCVDCENFEVNVFDEDNKAVQGAKVFLLDKHGFVLQNFSVRITNESGKAVFENVPSDEYFVLVQKYPFSSKAGPFRASEKSVSVKIVFEKASLVLSAVDFENKPVGFGFARVFYSDGSLLGSIPLDAQGLGKAEVLVGREFYVVFSADGFSNYMTTKQLALPKIENKVVALMERPSDQVSIRVSSIEKTPTEESSINKYKVKLVASFPNGFERAGIFVLAGDEKNNFVSISSVKHGVGSVLMGVSYSPPKSGENDLAELVETNGKWAQVLLDKSVGFGGNFEFVVDFVVRKGSQGSAFFSYRAFMTDASGNYYRAPYDESLGFSENSNSKDGFYAVVYKSFLENECRETICGSFYLVDNAENLVVSEPFELKSFSDYSLYFGFSSNANYDDVELRVIAGDSVFVTSYELENSEGQKFLLSNNETNDLKINVGKLLQGTALRGAFNFKYVGREKQGKLFLSLVSERNEIARKEFNFKVLESKDFMLNVFPQRIPLLEDFDLGLEAIGVDEKEPLSNAFVKAVVYKPKAERRLLFGETNEQGKASLKIMALEPGSKVEIIVGKSGFSTKKIIIKPSVELVKSEPKELNVFLSLDEPEKRSELKMTNLSSLRLSLKDVSFVGNFFGLLNQPKMNNFASQWKNVLLDRESASIIVLSSISESANFIDKKKSLKGLILFTFESSSGRIYEFGLPYFAEIYLASPPKNSNCIEVSLKDWKDHVIAGSASAEFFVRNNCLSVSGKPLPLKDVRAKVDWKTDVFGSIEVSLADGSGFEAKSVLGKNWSVIVQKVSGEKEFIAKLFFVPKQSYKGKKAEFSVSFDAAQDTHNGEQLVGSSNEIKSEIDIISLDDCVRFSTEFLKIEKNSNESFLEVDSSACGNVEITFSFCRNDPGCSNGAEGKISVQPEEFTLTPLLSKKRVSIGRQEIAGAYGLNVFVKTPGTNFRKLKQLDLLVEPSSEDAFELRRYEFYTIGSNSKDSTELINNRLSEVVSVDASVCDWSYASELPWFDFAGAGRGAITFALSGIIPAMKASKLAAQKTAENAGSVVKTAQDNGLKANSAAASDSEALKALCDRVKTQQTNVQTMMSNCSSSDVQAVGQTALVLVNDSLVECDALIAKNEAAKRELSNAVNFYDDIPINDVSGMVAEKKDKIEHAFFSDKSYVIPVSLGIAAAGVGLVKVVANYAQKKTGVSLIISKLDAAAAKLATAKSLAAKNLPAGDTCVVSTSNALMHVEMLSSDFKAYSSGELAKSSLEVSSFQNSNSNASSAVDVASKKITPASNAGKSFFTPTAIIGTYALTGFFLGGISTKLFGKDPCKERHVSNLPDYVINLLEGQQKIESDSEFSAEYDFKSVKVIGQYNAQRVRVVFSNSGLKSQEPVYKTFTFNALQHLHSNPTQIEKGNHAFGPFNVPDRETLTVAQKIRVKFNTIEKQEEMPKFSREVAMCETMNRTGRTGKGALPKVKFGWGFSDISINDCVEGKGEFYCDATQFSIMLSKRLKALEDFFAKNQDLSCPQNPLKDTYETIATPIDTERQELECYITDFSELIENKPALVLLLEANKDKIVWTNEIPDIRRFEEMIKFKSLLVKDSFSNDFVVDFAEHYSSQRFFDTDKWFTKLGSGTAREYSIADLFFSNRISFSNKSFDSYALPSPGIYDVYVKLGFEGEKRFFSSTGEPNVNVKVEFDFLQEPEFNSIFYYLPFDGGVGLKGNSFDRQDYGVSFDGDEMIFDSSTQPLKSLNSSASNSVKVQIENDNSFFGLNSSARTRGLLLSVEKGNEGTKIRFSPSYAMPVFMKVKSSKGNDLSAFYSFSNSEQSVDVGFVSSYWTGVGNCLDPQGNLIMKSFEEKQDRAATPQDKVVNWKSAYGVDFGKAQYSGDAYLKTIFYTNPKEVFSLKAESNEVSFITPYSVGTEVSLSNNQERQVLSLQDVFRLVESKEVCISGFGQKTEFFYNPKTIYENGKFVEFEKSLEGGKSCIGYQ